MGGDIRRSAWEDTSMKTPLPAHSSLLRNSRVEAEILGSKNERGGRMVIAHGRFATFAAAKTWADEVHADAERVNLTGYSARDGWQSKNLATRTEGGWLNV